jgi:hypothetical protein
MDNEKKPETSEKPAVEKKDEKPATKSSKPQSSASKYLIAVIVFIVLLIGAIAMGFLAERQFGNNLLQVIPKSLTAKLAGDTSMLLPEKIITPEASVNMPQPTTSPVASVKPSPVVVEESPPPDEPQATGEYILDFSDTRKVVKNDLIDLTPWELKVARNEIYARHGRPFVHKDLSCYFAKQPWYTLDMNYSDSSLSSLETANAVFIQNYEKEINSPLMNTDSGCK